MKKNPQQLPRKIGKTNAVRKSFLNNRRDIENANDLSQCVFLGVLRLKPVPSTLSRSSLPSGSTSSISHRLRRHTRSNLAKENSKKATKVISGKVTKKNRDKVRACIKKNPLGTSKVLRICLAMMNPLKTESSEATSFGASSPTFNPVDNLFKKLKQQMNQTESADSLDVSMFSSSVAKMNASQQVTLNNVEPKKKSDNLTNSTDNTDDIIWISDSGATGHHTQSSNDDIIFVEDSTVSKTPPEHTYKGPASISKKILTQDSKSITIEKPDLSQASVTATSTKQAPALAQTDEIYVVDDHDSSSECSSQNKSDSKQKEKTNKSRRSRLIPTEIPLKYVNAPRLLRSELYQKADQKRSASLEARDRTKEKSKPVRSEKVTFTIIKSSSEHNLNQKSRPEFVVKKQKSQDEPTMEASVKEKRKSASLSLKNTNAQESGSSDQWEITSSTQSNEQVVNVTGTSQKSTIQGNQPISLKLKLTKTTRGAVASTKPSPSKELTTDDVIFVDDTKQNTSSEKSAAIIQKTACNEAKVVTNTQNLPKKIMKTSQPETRISKNKNSPAIPPLKPITIVTRKDEITTAVTPNNANQTDIIIIEDAHDIDPNVPVPARISKSKSPESKIITKAISIVETVPRVLRSEVPAKTSNIDVPKKPLDSTVQDELLAAMQEAFVGNTSSEENVLPRVLRSSVSPETLNNNNQPEENNKAIFKKLPEIVTKPLEVIPLGRVLRSDASKTVSIEVCDEKQTSFVEKMEDRSAINEKPPNTLKSTAKDFEKAEKSKSVLPAVVIETVGDQSATNKPHEASTPGRVLRSEASKTVTVELHNGKQATLPEKMEDQPSVNEKLPTTLKSDFEKTGKAKVIVVPTVVIGEKIALKSEVPKQTETSQTQVTKVADNQNASEKSVCTLRSLPPHKSASPKSNEKLAEVSNQSVEANQSKISPQDTPSGPSPVTTTRTLRSTGEQLQPDTVYKSKENLTEKQATYAEKLQDEPKQQVENLPSRSLRSDVSSQNIPNSPPPQRKTKKPKEQQDKIESVQNSTPAKTRKDKKPTKHKNVLPLALRRLFMDSGVSRKSMSMPETSVINVDDPESNKENLMSKVKNVVRRYIGPKAKKDQAKQKLLSRANQILYKTNKKALKQKKTHKKENRKSQVKKLSLTPPKKNVQQKKIGGTPPKKRKNTDKVKLGKIIKLKINKKEKHAKNVKIKTNKSVKSQGKIYKEDVSPQNVENNLNGVQNYKKTRMLSSAKELQVPVSQTNVKSASKDKVQSKSKKLDNKQPKSNSSDRKNKGENNKKAGNEVVAHSKTTEKVIKKAEKRKRKEKLSSVKKMKLANEKEFVNTTKKLVASKKVANKKGKVKKNQVNVQVEVQVHAENTSSTANSDTIKGKKKKGSTKKSEKTDKDSKKSTSVVSKLRSSLRRSKANQQISENVKPEVQMSTTEEVEVIDNKTPEVVPETVSKVAQKSVPLAKTSAESVQQSTAVPKRRSKRTCVEKQAEQASVKKNKKVCDIQQHIIVASCDSSVNTTISLPPGTSIEPIVIEDVDVKKEVSSRTNESTNNNLPAKSSLSVFDFNESDMELNTPPLLTLQTTREEIKEKHLHPKERAHDVTYIIPEQSPANTTYTLPNNSPQDLNKTYTTLNPVPNASNKDALSALNTSTPVAEPGNRISSPTQMSTPKMPTSTNVPKGPKLYSKISSEELVKKRIERAERLKTQMAQSGIDLTVNPDPSPIQNNQIQVRRPSQICDPSKLKRNLPASSNAVGATSSSVLIKPDKVSPATPNSSTFEDIFNSSVKSPKKSPLKQPTILDMFAKMKQKNIMKAIFSPQPKPVFQESETQESRTNPQQQEESTISMLNRIPKEVSVTSEVTTMKESDSSDMPPPKLTAYGEDEDSDGESRMEWVPEEYAEYKFKYTAKKVMSYKPIFKCKVCLQMFPSYYKLNKHKRQHVQTDNPYKCQQCETSFNSVADLTAHIRVHKGKHPYTCKKCDTGLWTKEELDEHLALHNLKKIKQPDKKFRCDVCLKEFGRLYEVERHIRVHTGEKPFICNICNKGYQQRHNLSKHLLIHLDVRPFNCEICGKTFGRVDVLERHVLTHSVEKPVKCPHCNKDFIRHMQLKNHMKKRHKEFYDEATVDGVAVQLKDESADNSAAPVTNETVTTREPATTETAA
ncbi:unnamed protein product [Acanthoscelides obtectus]|uniref:C2H2-type domain-containing protein n=1 Tax=Acanthoscelides obtectus TaxID=200917 RepID=A0A9P0L0P0_ACAOB|nr:unnamed protein product [Acanthoscelides obtectus]CAK1654853.1 Zinc finger and BTB domain-containing protein 24 [Acanthoscelides obtectus]